MGERAPPHRRPGLGLPTGGLGWGMHGIAVEHRFISEIVLGAVEDGLAIQML